VSRILNKPSLRDLNARELSLLLVLVVGLVWMGLWPQTILDTSNLSMQWIGNAYQVPLFEGVGFEAMGFEGSAAEMAVEPDMTAPTDLAALEAELAGLTPSTVDAAELADLTNTGMR